jgi:dephospho-CoA kinase
MITIGITGQIGCGKSVVADEFARWGAIVVSGDRLGHEVVDKHPQLLKALVRKFGSQIITKTGRLNRVKLGAIAFADDEKTQSLNEIVHPWLLKQLRAEIARARRSKKSKILVVDAALIYNWRLEQELDYIVVVESTYKNQSARLKSRGLTEGEIRDRIRRQIPKYIQRRNADFVLTNNGTKRELMARAARLYERILRLAKSV